MTILSHLDGVSKCDARVAHVSGCENHSGRVQQLNLGIQLHLLHVLGDT